MATFMRNESWFNCFSIAGLSLPFILSGFMGIGLEGTQAATPSAPDSPKADLSESAPVGPLSILLKNKSEAPKGVAALPPGFSEVNLVCGLIGMMAMREQWENAKPRVAKIQAQVRASYLEWEKDPALSKLPCALRPDLSGQVGVPSHYYLYVPKSHQADAKRTYPVLLFLHGAGGNLRFGFQQGLSLMEKEGFILACPTYKNGDWWTPEGTAFALRVLDDISSKYRVDPKRVLIGGVSNGATGAWAVSQQHKKRFAGVISICGAFGGRPPTKPDPGPPLYIVHGEKDVVIPAVLSRTAFAALKHRKGTVYKEIPGAGHLVAVEQPEVGLPAALEWFKRIEEKGLAKK